VIGGAAPSPRSGPARGSAFNLWSVQVLIPTLSRRAMVCIALGFGLGAAAVAAAKEPSAEVKRQLFPAQNALGVDSLDQAWREAQKALALDPDVTQTHLILAEVALRKGDLKTAKAEYQKAKDLGGADGEALAGLSLTAFAEDDLAAAETLANQAIAADKGSW